MIEDKCLRFNFQFFFETHKTTKHQLGNCCASLLPVSIHSGTVVLKALGENSSAGTNHNASNEINPARHSHRSCNFAHYIKKLTPVAPPLSHWCLLFLATQVNPLFPFPEISMKSCCDKSFHTRLATSVPWM